MQAQDGQRLVLSGESALAHGRHGVNPHYRRGFVRFNQRLCEGLAQTRPAFISPVLVNARKLSGEPTPAKKHYVVGG